MTPTPPRARPRLQAVADVVPRGSRVADIGSDHGRLPRLLVRGGHADWCIATEYGDGPASRLRAGVAACAEADRIEVRQGDGLDPLRPDDRIHGLVLSGMGGPTMLSILDAGRLRALGVTWLVLQPQSGWGGLRAGLEGRGWCVSKERLVRDRGRYYTIMRAGAGTALLQAPEGFNKSEWYELGPCWFRDRDALALEYWAERSSRARARLRRAHGEGVRHARAAREFADRALAALKSPRVG